MNKRKHLRNTILLIGVLVLLSTIFSIANARDPDLHIQWQLRWSQSEILPGKPNVSFIGDISISNQTLKMEWVEMDGTYHIYNGVETLDGKRRILLLEFLTENQTYFSPSQMFSFKFPYENCSEWTDWEKPKYVTKSEGNIARALFNKNELMFVDAGNSPLFEIRYRIGSWSKLCDYRAKSQK